MPHIVFECSEELLDVHPAEKIMKTVHATVLASNLFDEGAIKIRINTYAHYLMGGQRDAYIHLFANIMPGRTVEQRAQLSKAVVAKLAEMFPDVKHITMTIDEIDKSVFFNAKML